jgi:hypothetical protein
MNLLKDMKFQVGLIGLVVAIIHYFIPDMDEKSLIDVVTAVVALVLGGHGVAQYLKSNK